jgi:alpha-2-macroglobulin-like protein
MTESNSRIPSHPDAHVADLVDDYLHGLLDAFIRAEVERHCDACPACKAALEDARRRLVALQAAPPTEASETLVQNTMRKVDAYRLDRKVRWRRFVAIAGGGLAAAVLLLAGLQIYNANLSATPYDLIVLGQRDLLASTNGSLRILLRDGKTYAPLANVPVAVMLVDRVSTKTAILANFTTDAHGSGQPRFALPDWADGAYGLRVVAQTAGTPETADLNVTLKRSSKVMLTSDKPVYQPGQVIHVRALALRRPDLHPVVDQPATFSVVDPKGNVVFKQQGKTSRYGITAADCPLDSEILEGAYTILCKAGDVESRLAVEVKKYVLPKFKVALKLDKPFYKPGDTIKFTVQADYFFTKPVAGADVDVDADVSQEMPGRPPAHFSGRTDSKGAASFNLPVPAPENGSTGPWHFHFGATVVDSAGQKQTASAEPVASSWPALIEAIPEAAYLVQGAPNKVYLLVSYLDGRPTGRVRVTVKLGGGGDGVNVETDEYGAAEIELPVDHWRRSNGGERLSLGLSAVDKKGREIAQDLPSLQFGPADDLLIRPDKAVYRGGDTMNLTAFGGVGPVFVDLIKEGQTLLTETIEMVDGKGEASVDLPADVFGTVQIVGYRVDAKGTPQRKTRVVYVRPAAEVHIAATLDPGKKTYKPGERPTLRLKLTDKEGRACPGAVSLAGVDEAVFSVLPQRPGTEQEFYTQGKELMEPVYKVHPWSPDAARSDRYELALFAAASWVDASNHSAGGKPMPLDGAAPAFQKGIASAVPVYSLETQSYPAKVEQTAELRTERLDLMKGAWVGLVVACIVVILLAFWFFVQTSALVKTLATGYVVIPLLLIAAAAFSTHEGFAPVLLLSKRQMARVSKSSPISEFAAAEGMPLGSDWGGDDPVPPPPPGIAAAQTRIREMFPETLLWRPELITDDDGTASLPLELADSITTWRLSASAVTADGKLGTTQLPVKVFKDFFVDLNLPVALTRGDEVSVPVVVYNYLDKPQAVTLTLADGDWFTRLDGAEQRLDLAAGEVRSVQYRVRAEKVGAYTLTVAAVGADDSDAVKRAIEIVPDGHRVEQVVNGTLEKQVDISLNLPEERIPGSEKAFVKIYPSSFSQLVEGLDNIFRMPNGCFEQTSSTTYPNVLALDYLKRTNQSAPAVRVKAERFIQSGYQRLLSFEVPGGGFDWFGRAPANRALTAYGLMEFTDMARVHDVDAQVIERTRRWLLDQRQSDGSWAPDDHKMHDDALGGAAGDDARLAQTAYIAWAVFGDPAAANRAYLTLTYLKSRNPESIKDAHMLALVCNALLAVDEHNADAAPYLDRLEAMKHFSGDGKFTWWEQAAGGRTTFYGAGASGNIETTALAALALIRAGRYPDTTRQALTWLTAQKDENGTWYSTQATVLSLRALLAGTGKPLGGDGERVIEVRVNGDLTETLRIPADQADVLKQVDLSSRLKTGKQVLTLSEASGAAVGFQASFRYNEPDAGPAVRKDPFAVELTYDRTEMPVGERIQATTRVVNQTGRAAPMVMMELPVPPGFSFSMEDIVEAMRVNKRIAKCQMQPRTVLLYLTGLDAGESLKIMYHLRATMPAKVAAAGARVYEYYDPDQRGSSPATRLTVLSRE